MNVQTGWKQLIDSDDLTQPAQGLLAAALERIGNDGAASLSETAKNGSHVSDAQREALQDGAGLVQIAAAMIANGATIDEAVAALREITPPETGGAWDAAAALSDGLGLTDERMAIELHDKWGQSWDSVGEIFESGGVAGGEKGEIQAIIDRAAAGVQYDNSDEIDLSAAREADATGPGNPDELQRGTIETAEPGTWGDEHDQDAIDAARQNEAHPEPGSEPEHTPDVGGAADGADAGDGDYEPDWD